MTRLSKDLAIEANAERATASSWNTAADALTGVTFSTTTKSDAATAETDLAAVASAAENEATALLSGNAANAQPYFAQYNSAFNNAIVALAALDHDLGLPQLLTRAAG